MEENKNPKRGGYFFLEGNSRQSGLSEGVINKGF